MSNELRNHQFEVQSFKLRVLICMMIVLVLFAILASRFYYLQVMQYQHYQTLAERNRITLVPIVPTRGQIYDRRGKVLADNLFSYTLEITPAKEPDLEKTIEEINKIVEISPQDRQRFEKLRRHTSRFDSVPIRTQLNDAEIATFSVYHYRFPSVEVKSRVTRKYPYFNQASHVIGYIGRINDRDIKRLTDEEQLSNYKGSDHIGKSGIERFYEEKLHGVTGFQQIEVDADGKAVRTLSTNPATAGENVTLSLDMELQTVAEGLFEGKRGALVAIDPKTGEVLSYVSKPDYDLNLFVGGIDHENWNRLNGSIDRPLINRPIRGLYPAASTIKPFIALAGLEHNLRQPPFKILDKGYFTLPNVPHRFRDWLRTGHGYVDISRAITISCDTFFYGLAVELGIKRIAEFVGHFGFGEKTGIDLPNEKAGLFPTPAWKNKRYNKPWYAGDTVNVGIGQGYTLVTAMQLAQATATLANKGIAIEPHFATQFQKSLNGDMTKVEPKIKDQILMNPENLEIVKEAMVNVTLPGGTAKWIGTGASYRAAAKTGTAQVVNIKQDKKYDAKTLSQRNWDHALLIAYAPVDDPKIAVAVIVENGEHGGSAAGPVIRKLFDYYLLGIKPALKATPVDDANQLDEGRIGQGFLLPAVSH